MCRHEDGGQLFHLKCSFSQSLRVKWPITLSLKYWGSSCYYTTAGENVPNFFPYFNIYLYRYNNFSFDNVFFLSSIWIKLIVLKKIHTNLLKSCVKNLFWSHFHPFHLQDLTLNINGVIVLNCWSLKATHVRKCLENLLFTSQFQF